MTTKPTGAKDEALCLGVLGAIVLLDSTKVLKQKNTQVMHAAINAAIRANVSLELTAREDFLRSQDTEWRPAPMVSSDITITPGLFEKFISGFIFSPGISVVFTDLPLSKARKLYADRCIYSPEIHINTIVAPVREGYMPTTRRGMDLQ